MHEDVAVAIFFSDRYSEIEIDLSAIKASFYSKISLKEKTIFTTSCYKRSPKHCNFFCLLQDGNFFRIDRILVVDSKMPVSTFVLGKNLGEKSKTTFLSNIVISEKSVIGTGTKCEGTSDCLIAITVNEIYRKCVVACNNDINDSVVLTALPHDYETD